MRTKITNGGKDEEFSKTNEEIFFEFSIYGCFLYAGGSTGSTATFEIRFDLTHVK
jgi:hypothetical protein